MTTGAVEVQGIVKHFGAVRAVDDVSFTAQAGSFLTLLGPSGCGKTTTLRMVAGFEPIDGGEIRIGGQIVNRVPAWKRQIGVVFQNYALFPHLTVFDNVSFGLRQRKIPRAEIRQQVGQALHLVNLPELGDRYPRQLSGGQQQRVALARALVLQPNVLLLDEPLSNLDAKLRAEMRFELKRIQHETGVTTLFVTHDQEEALTMSDRIVVMNQGRVHQIGTPRDVWENPQDAFVADFLGLENLLDGRVVEREERGRTVVQLENSKLLLASTVPADVRPNQQVVLGIRARHINLLDRQPATSENLLAGAIGESNYKGDVITYQVMAEHVSRPMIATATSTTQMSNQVWMQLDPAQILIFPKESTP